MLVEWSIGKYGYFTKPSFIRVAIMVDRCHNLENWLDVMLELSRLRWYFLITTSKESRKKQPEKETNKQNDAPTKQSIKQTNNQTNKQNDAPTKQSNKQTIKQMRKQIKQQNNKHETKGKKHRHLGQQSSQCLLFLKFSSFSVWGQNTMASDTCCVTLHINACLFMFLHFATYAFFS